MMDVIEFVKEYKQIERDMLERLSVSGAEIPLEVFADVQELLAVRRSWVLSWLFEEIRIASPEERTELLAVLWSIDSAA